MEEYKYVFFSHLFNLNQINTHTSKDVYYSHICKNLDPRDYCIIYLNHVDKNFLKKENKIFLDRSLSFYKEIKIFSELLFDTFKLFKKGLFERNIFKKKFYLFISINCISVSTLSNLRIFYQSYKIIRILKPKKITITYEGHAFERNVLRAANLLNSKIQKVAFHHSLPFKNQFSYLINFKNGSNPNVILASGKPSYEKLKKTISIKKTKFLLVGSNRIIKKNYEIKKKKQLNINCLVLPEGIESETELFINFVKKYLDNYNNINFTIRLHPILNNKKDFYKKFFKPEYFKNNKITFSENNNVILDFKKNSLCLYRGTSLVFNAMEHGILPVYIKNPQEIIFDPILSKDNFFKKTKFQKLIN